MTEGESLSPATAFAVSAPSSEGAFSRKQRRYPIHGPIHRAVGDDRAGDKEHFCAEAGDVAGCSNDNFTSKLWCGIMDRVRFNYGKDFGTAPKRIARYC